MEASGQIPEHALDADRVVSAGKIHMLGLNAIKERLGSKWDRMSELVHRYFEAALRREMGPGDTFYNSDELSYLVLFRGATLAETQFKCSVIASDVCKRLFGDEDEEISVRSLTLPVDDVDLESEQARLHLDSLLEREGDLVVFQPNGSTDSGPKANLRVRMDARTGGIHYLSREQPTFLYRPLWDSLRGVILTYLSQPFPATVSGSWAFGGLCEALDGEREQAELDRAALYDCLQRAEKLRKAGLRVQFAVPVHFSTVSRTRYWRNYAAIRDAASKDLLKDIAFLVHGIDPSVPNIRLVDELPKLRIFSRHQFCVVKDPALAARQFRNTGISAAGIVLRQSRSETEWIEPLSNLYRVARDNGFDCFALGAQRRSAVINAIGAGVRFVEGPGVRQPLAEPRHVYGHDVTDFLKNARIRAEQEHRNVRTLPAAQLAEALTA